MPRLQFRAFCCPSSENVGRAYCRTDYNTPKKFFRQELFLSKRDRLKKIVNFNILLEIYGGAFDVENAANLWKICIFNKLSTVEKLISPRKNTPFIVYSLWKFKKYIDFLP